MASVSMTQKEVYIFVREKKREREMCLFEHLQELRILNDLIQKESWNIEENCILVPGFQNRESISSYLLFPTVC